MRANPNNRMSRAQAIQQGQLEARRQDVVERLAKLGIVRLSGDPLDLSYAEWNRLIDLAERAVEAGMEDAE